MFRLKITVMGIFPEIYSFRLNVVWGTSVMQDAKCAGQSFIQFLWETYLAHIQSMCLLDWICRLIRKYKLPFSFKAASPCSMNKCL